jgi:hypothetical protein
MKTTITDVTIHTKDQLSDQPFAEVTEQVDKPDAIISPSRNEYTPKFLMVVYNAAPANRILTTVKGLGYDTFACRHLANQ